MAQQNLSYNFDTKRSHNNKCFRKNHKITNLLRLFKISYKDIKLVHKESDDSHLKDQEVHDVGKESSANEI